MANERPAPGREPRRAAPPPPIYGEDLAYIHHVGFGDLARDAAPALLDELRRAGMTGGLVVDLACGSGILARELLAAGYDVLGVDASPAMIELARATAPAARFVVASLSGFRIPECAAVFCIGEGLGYLDPAGDRVDLGALVDDVYEALFPGGAFAFDVLERTDDAPMRYEAERAGPGWRVRTEVSEDVATSIVTRRITTLREVGGQVRTATEVHRVFAFPAEDVARTVRARGFSVRLVRAYGAAALAPRRLGVVARKPRG